MDLVARGARGERGLLSFAWNQDTVCFACGFENGFRVYNCEPLKEKQRREFGDGGIGPVEMLFRCNYLALVGGGKPPKFPTNKVMIWDDQAKKCVVDMTFKSEVLGVRLRRDRIVVILRHKVMVYTFTLQPQLVNSFDTCENPWGLCVLSPDMSQSILTIPGSAIGQVQVIDLADASHKAPSVIAAHEGALSCLAINSAGTMIASSSDKGTLIRVFDVPSGRKLYELRRGAERAVINCINFNADSTMLCVSSDHNTVHVFTLEPDKAKAGGLASAVLPKYFSSTWSTYKFQLSSPHNICAFGKNNVVMAVCADGQFFKATIKGKDDVIVESQSFLDLPALVGGAEPM